MWSWFKRKPSGVPVPAPAGTPAGGPPLLDGGAKDDLARLAAVGLPGGPSVDEALARLAALRSSPSEGRALEELLRRRESAPLPDPVAVAAAAALVDRGELALAERCLQDASSSAALTMSADLASEAGDVTAALARIERVLLRDLDHPGARERHRRWRAQLGFTEPKGPVTAGATTMVARDADAPFELLREVARGGAGAVYEAVDRDLGRPIALKVYHQPERDRAQLWHEARVAVALASPGVIRVYDIDPDHGWIALAWCPRGAIRDLLREKRTDDLARVDLWAPKLATTLAAVHAVGWVHHDVKPANVLLESRETPILTDFGIARRRGEPSPGGSLGFVSPERMKGRASDPRDDIYGYGRLLEDVLDVLDTGTRARWGPLAAACTGPDAARPQDGRALVTRVRVELGA